MNKLKKQKDEKIREEVITMAMKEEEIKQAYSNIPLKKVIKKTNNSISKQKKENTTKIQKKKTEIRNKSNFKKILLFIILILLLFISIDIISVAKFDKGPFFAIPIKKHKDGSKEYYGIGYKVIIYNEKVGRTHRKIGFWNLKYKKIIHIKDSNLLMELLDNDKKTYNKYKDKLIKINTTLYEIDPESQKTTAKYNANEKDTILFIICPIDETEKQNTYNKIKTGENSNVVGNITKIKTKIKDEKKKINIYMRNCSIEQ